MEIALNGFWMGQYEVTQAEWDKVMGRTLADQFKLATTRPGATRNNAEGPRIPIYFVTQDESAKFAGKLTEQERAAGRLPGKWEFRLPSPPQWEYACRAGTTTRFVSGDSDQGLGEYAWFALNSGNTPHDVGTRKANAWGLHDMHGNIGEWCVSDAAERRRLGPETAIERLARGGGYNGTGKGCRSASRGSVTAASQRFPMIGFRLVAVPVDDE